MIERRVLRLLLGRLVAVLLAVVLVSLVPLAHASPPDPTWTSAGQLIIGNAMVAQVPESATLTLLGAGAVSLAAMAWRRRRQPRGRRVSPPPAMEALTLLRD